MREEPFAGRVFSARRMIMDYTRRRYLPADVAGTPPGVMAD